MRLSHLPLAAVDAIGGFDILDFIGQCGGLPAQVFCLRVGLELRSLIEHNGGRIGGLRGYLARPVVRDVGNVHDKDGRLSGEA